MAKLTLVATILLCVAVPWLPDPVRSNTLVLPFVGFMLLIFAGLRAAFREDKAGLFAFWFRPSQMSKSRLDQKESDLVRFGAILIAFPILSAIVRLAVT